jgi:hypothetical protein
MADEKNTSTGLFSQILNMVWVPNPNPNPQSQAPAIPVQTEKPQDSVEKITDDSDNFQIDFIRKNLDDQIRNHPNFKSFASFIKIVMATSEIIPDETIRFKAALATIELTKADLILSINIADEIIDKERCNFKNTFVAKQESDLNEIHNQENEIHKQIEALNAELEILNKNKIILNQKSAELSTNLSKTTNNFNIAAAASKTSLDDFVAKLNQFIKD